MEESKPSLNHWHELSRLTNHSQEILRPFLEFIDAPTDLYAFLSVMQNVKATFQHMDDLIYPDLDEYRSDIKHWIVLIDQMLVKLKFIEVPAIWLPKHRVRRDNLIGGHPIYAIFTESGVEYEAQWQKIKLGLSLIMVVVIKNYNQLVKVGVIEKANTYHVNGTRSIRELELASNRVIVPPSPFLHDDLETYLNELAELNEAQPQKWLSEFLSMSYSYLEHREGYSRRYRNSFSFETEVSHFKESTESGYEHVSIEIKIHQEKLDEKSQAKIKTAGLNPFEFKGQSLAQVTSENQNGLSDKRSTYKKLKAINQSIIATAQHIYYNNSELTPLEILTFIKEIQCIDHHHISKAIPAGVAEIKSLLYLLIFTGRSLADVQTLRFMSEKKFQKSTKKNLTWCYDSKLLHIPAHSNNVHNNLDATAKAIIQICNFDQIPSGLDNTYSIVLPSFVNDALMHFYREWKKVREATRNKKGFETIKTMAFTDADCHASVIGEIIKRINQKFDINVGLQKISESFRQAILYETNDQAEYILITNQNFNHAIVSSHYYSVTKANLCRIHTTAINYILQKCGLNEACVEYHEFDTFKVGSKLILSSEIIQDFIADLLTRINDAKRDNVIFKIHNAFTTYILALFGFATGYRAIRDPINFKYQINKTMGFICLCDKDNDANSHTRLIPVAKVVLDQLIEYEYYLKVLVSKLGLFPNAQHQIRTILQNNDDECTAPYFFYLTEHYRITSVSPRSIRFHINQDWKLPANVNRHYIRTRMREFDCPSEFVDYFMGHWEHGEEPFNAFSLVSPIEIRNITLPTIEKILKQDGWKVCKSPYGK
jgi:hypothetical protein